MQNSGEVFNTYSASLVDALETGTQHSVEPKDVNIYSEPLSESSQNMERLTPQNISIDMESHIGDETAEINDIRRNEPLSMQRNFLDFFQNARSQLDRNSGPNQHGHRTSVTHVHDLNPNVNNRDEYAINYGQNIHNHTVPTTSPYLRNIRSWRMNLNNVLSFSTPSTETIRSLITNSGTFSYTPLATTGTSVEVTDNAHLSLDQEHETTNQQVGDQPFLSIRMPPNTAGRTRINWVSSQGGNESVPTQERSNLPREDLNLNISTNNTSHSRHQEPTTPTVLDTSLNMLEDLTATHLNRNQNSTNRNPLQEDEENNLISDMFIKALTQFMRYLPFVCILFVKFIHDHLLGIIDLLLLHGIMYQLNKSLRDQVAKCSQKSYGILFRDLGLVAVVVVYRFLWSASTPDPFGLLISPPTNTLTLDLTINSDSSRTNEKLAVALGNYLENSPNKDQNASAVDSTVSITKAISVGLLIYYVAVNDLVLKLITIMFKISVTLMPAKVIRHKPRARIYVVIEYLSQFYRSLAPIRQWLIFLYESHSGLEVISGVLFSSFYMGVKGFEFVRRGKSLKKALEIFLHNMEYERKPTKDELRTAGSLCPICHDTYNAPVVLECGHIFCDECVSTWFKREQTCPMCRAKVTEDPIWQDGSTTFFYQLC